MPSATVNDNVCKGCGLCVDACPKKIMGIETKRLNQKGYHPAVCNSPDDCVGCAFCAIMCPDVAIVVERD